MPVPAAARLVEFSRAPVADRPLEIIQTFTRPAKPSPEIAVDREAERVASAFLRGRNEGLEAARAEYETKLAEAEAAFEERLAAQRSMWTRDEGVLLAGRIDAAFDAMNAEVGDTVAAILLPFLEGALRTKIVDELLRTLEKTLRGGRPASLKITGPADLLEAIRTRLGDTAIAIDFEATGDIDVRVVADSTVIETQLGAWLRQMSGRTG